jgi:hypothetical protein
MFATCFGDPSAPLKTSEDDALKIVKQLLHHDHITDGELATIAELTVDVRKRLKIRDWTESIYAAVMWCGKQGLTRIVSRDGAIAALDIKCTDMHRIDKSCGAYMAARGGGAQTRKAAPAPVKRSTECYNTFVMLAADLCLPPSQRTCLHCKARAILDKLPSDVIGNTRINMLCAAVCHVICTELYPHCRPQHIQVAFGVSQVYKKYIKAIPSA